MWYGMQVVKNMKFVMNGRHYEVLRFLGKGKGGYSYLDGRSGGVYPEADPS